MMRAVAGITLIALFCGVAFGQTKPEPAASPSAAFDVADVHSSPHSSNPNPFMTGGVLRGGRYDLRNATMVDMISQAWGVTQDTVLGGPNWLETDRFDIAAKAPPGTSPDTVKLMLQGLLADRFKLMLHADTKPMPGFVLSLGKGKPKMKESDGSASTGCQGQPQKPEPGVVPYAVVQCRGTSMGELARMLRLMAGAYINSTVIDSTGLQGAWDFDLKWTGRAQLGQAGADGITIFDAVDKELGLKLEPQRIPAPVLIVDSVNEKPTGNPPEVTSALPPPPPAEFEVAVVKPSAPDARTMARIQPGGRFDVEGLSLKFLIAFAWNFDPATNDMIVGLPKYAESARYDITAKAPTAISGSANNVQADIDDLRLMLQALLKDRFKLAAHMEDRPVSAFNLVAVKPKLKKADPMNRTGWKEGPGADGKDPRIANPTLSRLITCQNMTMAQFADLLQKMANGYIHSPVLDKTGLEGGWDFTLSFSAAGLLQSAPGGRGGGDAAQQAPGGVATASDPNGALSLPDAINKQLGLKLEEVKRPVPVLIIDHLDEKPTEN
jgi:uncharacterized protein (TIGR03435 family)